MFEKLKSKNLVLLNIFIKVSCIVCFITIILTIVLYNGFHRSAMDILEESREKMLSQISSSALYMDSNVKNYAMTIFNNSDTMQIMYINNVVMEDYIKNFKKLDDMVINMPYIYSVYIYNSRLKSLFSFGSTGEFGKAEAFFDREIADLLSKQKSINILKPIAREIPVSRFDPQKKINVLSYIIFEKGSGVGTNENAVVVNVKAEWIFETIRSMNIENLGKESEIVILDKNGKMIGSKENQAINNSDLLKRINSGSNRGNFISVFNGNKMIINYIYSDTLEWLFVSVLSYSDFIKPVKVLLISIIFISTGVLVLAILLSFIISRILYKPIKKLHESLNSLKSFKWRNREQIKEGLLNKLLVNEFCVSLDVMDKFAECEVNLDIYGKLIVCIIRIDDFMEHLRKYNERDRDLLFFALKNISNEIFTEEYKCEFTKSYKDHIVGIINVNDHNDMGKITGLVKKIQENVLKYFDLSVSASISGVYSDIGNLSYIYKVALDNSNYRIKYGRMCIITQDDVNMIGDHTFEIPDDRAGNLDDALKLGNLPRIKDAYSQIADSFYKYKYNDVILGFMYLSVRIFEILNIIEKNGKFAFELDLSTFVRKISMMETMEQFNNEFNELFEMIAQKFEECKDNRTTEIIDAVKTYVKNNYVDKNLSLAEIADKLNLSSDYLGKIFRRETSKSVGEYIQEQRILKAGELLKQTSYNINEIMDKIGWENKQYFYIIFKKQLGVTPSEYRNKHLL